MFDCRKAWNNLQYQFFVRPYSSSTSLSSGRLFTSLAIGISVRSCHVPTSQLHMWGCARTLDGGLLLGTRASAKLVYFYHSEIAQNK